MNATEYANIVLQTRLNQLYADPKTSKETQAAIAQLLLGGRVDFGTDDHLQQYKFKLGEPVLHVKSGHEYVIVELPHNNYLEASNKPCYGYIGVERIVWHRCQEEMEDGRFVSLYMPQPEPMGRFGGERGFGTLPVVPAEPGAAP
jgi:hypothetical protein